MPYVITTSTHNYPDGSGYTVHTRLAVATLEGTRLPLHEAIDRWEGDSYLQLAAQIDALTESGGTVGPLPDGTTIKVAPESWSGLAGDLHADTNEMTCGEVLSLFNIEQGA